jgi:CBS domain-containing protein
MEPGPTTVHPDADLPEVTRRMCERNVDSIIVTDPGGRVIGVLRNPETAANGR